MFIGLYDKRNDFNFKVNWLTNWFSWISNKVQKNILFSQVKKIRSICNNDEDWKTALKNLEIILLVNWYPSHLISNLLHLKSYFSVVCSGKIEVLVSRPTSPKGFAFFWGGSCFIASIYSFFSLFTFGLLGILSVLNYLCIV